MTGKNFGLISVIAGAGLLAISLLADFIGVGSDPGLGIQQVVGAVAGGVLALMGLVVMRKTT